MGCGASAEPKEKPLFVFRFRLLGGLNLYNNSFGIQVPGTYSNAGRFEGASDPYAVVQCSGSQQIFTSEVRLHEQNPVWNQEFYFNTNTTAPELSIQVRDKDFISSDDVIGTAKVNLHGLIGKTGEREIWVPLEGSKAKGEIGFAVVECFRCHITAQQGVDVQPMDTLSGSSDVYMTLQVGQQEAHKTSTKKWTLNPIWNETFTVFVPYGIKSQLAMILYDHDSVGTDNNMGWHYEYFDGKPQKEPRDLKCPITNAKGRLEFKIQDDTTLEGVTDAGPVPEAVKAKWPRDRPQSCTIECRVLGAYNLAVADFDVAGALASEAGSSIYHEYREYTGKSDPFARVNCEGVVYDTRHINNTLEPVWNEKFRFVVNNREQSALNVEVLDHDLAVNDSIGAVRIPINALKPGQKQEIWSFLDRGRGEIGVEVQMHNQLHVKVVKGENLPAKDLNGMCDPFVKLYLGSKEYQTRVVRNDRNPWFEEDFRFCQPTLNNLTLRIEVYDSDLMILRKNTSADLIGTAEVDLASLAPGLPNERKIAIKSGNKEEGHITLILTEEVPLPASVLNALKEKGKEAFEAAVKGLNEVKEMISCLKLPDFDKKEEAKYEVADPKLAPRPRFGRLNVELVATRGLRRAQPPIHIGLSVPQQGKRVKSKEYTDVNANMTENFQFNVPSKGTGSLEVVVFESAKHAYTGWSETNYGKGVINFKSINGGEGIIRGARADDTWVDLGGDNGKVIVRISEMFRFQVKILRGKDMKVDKDPLVRVALGKDVRLTSFVSAKPDKDRTTGVPGAPVWDEQFTFFANEKGLIEFRLMDVGILGDEFLGKGEFDLQKVRRGVPVKATVALTKADKPAGSLEIEILEEEQMSLVDKLIDGAANAAKLAEALAAELKAAAAGAAGEAGAAIAGAAGAAAGALGGMMGKLF